MNGDSNIVKGKDNLIGESEVFHSLLEEVSQVSKLARPVLIIGERGTGKELIAERVHFLSRRWDKQFIKLNCSTLSNELLESELFGHEAGAFTGAIKRHIGRFEMADGGSIFLDEVANTSLRLQEKILRVVEYGEFERVGGSTTLSTDPRIIAATNADLPYMAQRGRFRFDLLDRLAFDVLTVPPLRARGNDIFLLTEYFANKMVREMKGEYFPGLSECAQEQLISYHWPGNVRELKNVIERAVYKSYPFEGPIDYIEIDPFESPFRPTPESFQAQDVEKYSREKVSTYQKGIKDDFSWIDRERAIDFKNIVKKFEKEVIQYSLKKFNFNQKKTSSFLKLTYNQFRGLLRKHGLKVND